MKTELILCECQDPLCPCHYGGQCGEKAECEIERIDMLDAGSMVFCDDCANEVLQSGLFRDLGQLYQ